MPGRRAETDGCETDRTNVDDVQNANQTAGVPSLLRHFVHGVVKNLAFRRHAFTPVCVTISILPASRPLWPGVFMGQH